MDTIEEMRRILADPGALPQTRKAAGLALQQLRQRSRPVLLKSCARCGVPADDSELIVLAGQFRHRGPCPTEQMAWDPPEEAA